MQLIELYPHWATAPDETLIKDIGPETLMRLINRTAEYYNKIPFAYILPHFGVGSIALEDETYCPCVMPSHGSRDNHASAKVFIKDRETGKDKHTYYCYKCEKAMQPFWFVYDKLKDEDAGTLRGALLWFSNKMRVPLPRDLWLPFDPMDVSDIWADENVAAVDHEAQARYLNSVAALRHSDPQQYLSTLKSILSRGLAGG